jgi:hypothetical protein
MYFYQWLYLRIGYGLFQLYATVTKPASYLQATQLLSVMLTLTLLMEMAATAESLTLVN